MRKIVVHTFVTVFLFMLLLVLYLLLGLPNGGAAVLALLYALFCAPFPTYLAVLIYRSAKKKIIPGNKIVSILSSTLLLLIIYHIGLILFILMGHSESWTIFINTMINEYTGEYGTVNIPAILLIIAIPLAELLITKVERDMKEEREKLQKK